MSVSGNLARVRKEIADSAIAANRSPDAVRLVAVSKKVGLSRIQEAADAGQRIFGENYVQEAREKIEALADRGLSWHMIGRLQSNKARIAVSMFDLIHSVDSIKLANAIDAAAARISKVQDILIQVNVAGEASKAGIDVDTAADVLAAATSLPHIRAIGLMTMPPFFDDPQKARPIFAQLHDLMQRLNARKIGDCPLTELSMGMSGDMTAAVAEGATFVRVGTAIFGERR